MNHCFSWWRVEPIIWMILQRTRVGLWGDILNSWHIHKLYNTGQVSKSDLFLSISSLKWTHSLSTLQHSCGNKNHLSPLKMICTGRTTSYSPCHSDILSIIRWKKRRKRRYDPETCSLHPLHALWWKAKVILEILWRTSVKIWVNFW